MKQYFVSSSIFYFFSSSGGTGNGPKVLSGVLFWNYNSGIPLELCRRLSKMISGGLSRRQIWSTNMETSGLHKIFSFSHLCFFIVCKFLLPEFVTKRAKSAYFEEEEKKQWEKLASMPWKSMPSEIHMYLLFYALFQSKSFSENWRFLLTLLIKIITLWSPVRHTPPQCGHLGNVQKYHDQKLTRKLSWHQDAGLKH